MLRVDFNISRLSLCAAQRLMDHDFRIREGHSLAFRAACQQKGSHACRHTDTDRRDIAFDKFHRIINCHTGRNRAAGAVDIQMDILVRVFRFQEKKLSHNEARRYIVYFLTQENNSFFEQSGINVIGTFSAACLFDYIRY